MKAKGLEEIKKRLLDNKVLYEKAEFQCFCDNLFVYQYEDIDTIHEINITSKRDRLKTEKIIDLLNSPDLTYISYSVYIVEHKKVNTIDYLKQ